MVVVTGSTHHVSLATLAIVIGAATWLGFVGGCAQGSASGITPTDADTLDATVVEGDARDASAVAADAAVDGVRTEASSSDAPSPVDARSDQNNSVDVAQALDVAQAVDTSVPSMDAAFGGPDVGLPVIDAPSNLDVHEGSVPRDVTLTNRDAGNLNPGWTRVSVGTRDATTAAHGVVRFDTTGNVHIAFCSGADILYATGPTGGPFTTSTLVTDRCLDATSDFRSIDIAVDSANVPAVAWLFSRTAMAGRTFVVEVARPGTPGVVTVAPANGVGGVGIAFGTAMTIAFPTLGTLVIATESAPGTFGTVTVPMVADAHAAVALTRDPINGVVGFFERTTTRVGAALRGTSDWYTDAPGVAAHGVTGDTSPTGRMVLGFVDSSSCVSVTARSPFGWTGQCLIPGPILGTPQIELDASSRTNAVATRNDAVVFGAETVGGVLVEEIVTRAPGLRDACASLAISPSGVPHVLTCVGDEILLLSRN